MAKRTQTTPSVFPSKFSHSGPPGSLAGVTTTQYGLPDYTGGRSAASLDEIYRAIDGAVAHEAGLNWRLRILAIHEVGPERWIQLSAVCHTTEHDLVLHMTPQARTSDVIASIEAWLTYPVLTDRIIHIH